MADQVIVALGGLAVAAIGILSNAVVQIWSTRKSADLKKYEITFLEKRKAFVALMQLLNDRAYNALM
ncbi:MAG TPA: hypothetical protein VKS03_04805, partial [Thermoanaerobaculia bacterium]|nr:hypothetical protein [Thermoanaerobaculia bacterium]